MTSWRSAFQPTIRYRHLLDH